MKNKFKAVLRLIRPANCFMMGFAVIVGALMAKGTGVMEKWVEVIMGFLTGFTLTAASMVVNDYYDREIDAINQPDRPIPSGIVTPNQAIFLALIFTVVGFGAAALINFPCFLIAIASYVVSVTYSTVGKKTGLLGNFMVSACVAIPFIFGNFLVERFDLAVFLFAAMAFLSNTGREITKGIADIKGDKARNIKTLAVRRGEKTAALGAAFFYLAAVALTPLPLIWSIVSFWFLPFVAVTNTGLIVSSLALLRDCSSQNARKIKNAVLLWFVFGLLAFLFGTSNL